MLGNDSPYKASTKEESERLRGERDKINFDDFRLQGGPVVRFRERRKQGIP